MSRTILRALGDRFRRLPSTDLYVAHPLRRLRGEARGHDLPPLHAIGGNAYLVGRTGILVRYGDARDLDALRRSGAARIVYVADDDFAAGAEDEGLPAAYRARLAAFVAGPWPDLVAAADTIIVSSPVLAASYGARTRVMRPAWHLPPPAAAHFDGSTTFEIAHLGSASHRADLETIAPALAAVLRDHSDARVTIVSPGTAPGPLDGHPQVRAIRPMRWWRYRQALPRMRFHLALTPMRPTAFNRARSANKLFEHALTGAASLLTPNPALRDAAGSGLAVFVEHPEDWPGRLAAALADRSALRRLVEATRTEIAAADPLGAAADIWHDILTRGG
jgi:hypothetical protein